MAALVKGKMLTWVTSTGHQPVADNLSDGTTTTKIIHKHALRNPLKFIPWIDNAHTVDRTFLKFRSILLFERQYKKNWTSSYWTAIQ